MRKAVIWAIIGISLAILITLATIVGVYSSNKKKETAGDSDNSVTVAENETDKKDIAIVIPEPEPEIKRYFYVEFDVAGGNGIMSKSELECGESHMLPLNRFSRSGYEFAGWAASYNGDICYTDGSLISSDIENEKIRLYAVWSIRTQYTQFFGTQNHTRDKTITDSKSFSETISPGLDRDGLLKEGYTKLQVTIDLRLRETNDGYEKITIYDKNGKKLCDKEFEYGPGRRIESWGGEKITLEIQLAKLDSDCQLNVTYSCRGNWGGAAFVLGETTYTINAVR